MQYAATGRRWYTAGIVQMSYQRALFYFAQLSRMIFSVHLASTRGSASEILQHGRDLTCLIQRVCCRGCRIFFTAHVPLATLNCLLFGITMAISKRSTSYPVNESRGVGRTSIGLLAKNRDYTYWPGARFAQEFLAHGGNSQETQRAACENRAGKFRDDVLELTGGLGKTKGNFSAKGFSGHPKGRA